MSDDIVLEPEPTFNLKIRTAYKEGVGVHEEDTFTYWITNWADYIAFLNHFGLDVPTERYGITVSTTEVDGNPGRFHHMVKMLYGLNHRSITVSFV